MTAKILAFVASPEEEPILLNGQIPPKRVRNADVRTREYLTPDEVDALMKAAKTMGRAFTSKRDADPPGLPARSESV